MEQLLHYIWKHKIFPLRELTLTDGRSIEVLNPGIHNTDAGPDFKGAKIKIDGMVWAGNVEIHTSTSDWYRHGHDNDPAYSNIILHVASNIDSSLLYPDGQPIPQMKLEVPQYINNSYEELKRSDVTPRCKSIIRSIPSIMVHSWMSSLQVERLEMRTQQILARRERLNKNWEDTFFVTIARAFGFGKNGDAFEQWANSIPMSAVGKHRDNLFQIEAIFFGQAGLLETPYALTSSTITNETYSHNDYYYRLQREYKYLRQKFSLTPIDSKEWKFLRLRPQNFPHIRIAQLAMLYYTQSVNLSKTVSTDSIEEITQLFHTHVSAFWRTHYSFTSDESSALDKQITTSSIQLLVINAIVPILFAYGRYKGDESLCERSISLWECIPPEKNRIITDWKDAGITPEHAADTQALLQLHHNYCQRRDCLRCRFANEFIRRNPGFLREKEIDT